MLNKNHITKDIKNPKNKPTVKNGMAGKALGFITVFFILQFKSKNSMIVTPTKLNKAYFNP
jgi:hypothetical protein